MKTISGKVLKLLGWKITGDVSYLSKSVIIFAPHTSYYDAVYGKLFLNEIGINHIFLSKKELFFFPMNIILKWYGSVSVQKGHKNTINQIVDIINTSQSTHIVLSPEGTRKKAIKWNKGFYYMALKSKVPIVVGFIDFKKKEVGIKSVIYDIEDYSSVMHKINLMYNDIQGKCPENFTLDKRFS